jgi:hypothetical protein
MRDLICYKLEIYFKVTKRLIEIDRQGKRINWSVNIRPIYQVNNTKIEHIQDLKGDLL